MPRTRVHNLNISLDGYAAGEHVTFKEPIGGANRLFEWFDGRAIHGVDGVDDPWTLDRALTSLWGQGVGAEIMGRGKFGPEVGEWPDDGWRGWWGDEPPFRTPVFVMSHYPHPTVEFGNGTSFHSWTEHRRTCCSVHKRPPADSTSGSEAGLPRFASSSRPDWWTSCTS